MDVQAAAIIRKKKRNTACDAYRIFSCVRVFYVAIFDECPLGACGLPILVHSRTGELYECCRHENVDV